VRLFVPGYMSRRQRPFDPLLWGEEIRLAFMHRDSRDVYKSSRSCIGWVDAFDFATRIPVVQLLSIPSDVKHAMMCLPVVCDSVSDIRV